MSDLRKALDEYLALRRALGFKLTTQGQLLENFVDFAAKEGASFITRKLALRWATQPTQCQPARWARRLDLIRGFAQYRSAADPRTEIPPQQLLPHRYRRRTPYICSDEDIVRLMEAAKQLRPFSAVTFSTLFGLLAVTGMRIGETLGLDRGDLDLTEATILVRQGKFGKSRLVPVHVSTRDALIHYATVRDRKFPRPKTPAFFVSARGARLRQSRVNYMFLKLVRRIGLRSPTGALGPRIHDMRHGFAIRTLLRLYRAGEDIERHLPVLSTYLGHVDVSNTYWYLSATPELLRLASMRLEEKRSEVTP